MSGLMEGAKDLAGQEGGQEGSKEGSKEGGLAGLESQGKEAMLDQKINSELTDEGVPKSADATIDKEVNAEAGKFL